MKTRAAAAIIFMTRLCPDNKADSITCAPKTFDKPTSSGDQIAPASKKYIENHQKFVFSNPAAKYVGSREPGTKRLPKITGTPRRGNHVELFSTPSARMNHFNGARRIAGLPRYLPAKKSSRSPTNIPRKQANAPTAKLIRPCATITPAPMQVRSSLTNVETAMSVIITITLLESS